MYSYRRYHTSDLWDRPSRWLDTNFFDDPSFYRSSVSHLPYYMRPHYITSSSTVTNDKDTQKEEHNAEQAVEKTNYEAPAVGEVSNSNDKFTVQLSVLHFTPEEIQVKVVENMLIIEARHDEKVDEHGFVERYIKRRYVLPKDVNAQSVSSDLSADGVLTVTAAKINVEPPKERVIPVQFSATKQPQSILKKKH